MPGEIAWPLPASPSVQGPPCRRRSRRLAPTPPDCLRTAPPRPWRRRSKRQQRRVSRPRCDETGGSLLRDVRPSAHEFRALRVPVLRERHQLVVVLCGLATVASRSRGTRYAEDGPITIGIDLERNLE